MLRVVKTENGYVKGLPAADPRITAFRGIPFAAPPVGENRWRAPQPCADWEGTREAFQFGPIAMQDTPGLGTDIYCREWHVDPEIPMDEDCLYLNVWTNAKSADEKLPVMIWFYGGALQWGYPAEMEFNGERIARRGVVVVTVNYRINVFGFLSHPQLTKEQPDAPANFGNLDQKAGIEWVIRNIAAFGGDPNNITIAGQSAGGGSVLTQMTSPQNIGKFQRAVVMSAMIESPTGQKSVGYAEPITQAEKNGEAFFDFIGAKNLEEARKIDAITIRNKYAEFAANHPRMVTVQDDVFCPGTPLDLIREGRCMQIPILSGNTTDEFLTKIGDKFISGIECTVKNLARIWKAKGIKQDIYYYTFDADIPGEDHPGTFHSVDLWFFFETLASCSRAYQGRHYDLARYMCNYLTNFIKTGNPNGADADGTPMAQWIPYTKETPCSMIFRTDGLVSMQQTEKEDIMPYLHD